MMMIKIPPFASRGQLPPEEEMVFEGISGSGEK